MLEGKSIPNVTIEVCHTGQGMQASRRYELSNVLISYFEESSFSENKVTGTEFLRMNFTKIEKRHTNYQSNGQSGQPVSVGFDLEKAKAV